MINSASSSFLATPCQASRPGCGCSTLSAKRLKARAAVPRQQAAEPEPEPEPVPEGLTELRALFDSLDADHDGNVSSSEWGRSLGRNFNAMSKAFGGATKAEVGKKFKTIEANGDGLLSWDEVVAAVGEVKQEIAAEESAAVQQTEETEATVKSPRQQAFAEQMRQYQDKMNAAQQEWCVLMGIWPLNSNKTGRAKFEQLVEATKTFPINRILEGGEPATAEELSPFHDEARRRWPEFEALATRCPHQGVLGEETCNKPSCRHCRKR